MINYLRLLLLPFSLLYGLVTMIRNKLYDWKFYPSMKFDVPVICVGNLVVGGSGKTPVTEYLVGLLDNYKIAILSRGYGRSTKGFILADEKANAELIGDEPMQYYKKFKQVSVAVCEDRVKGIRLLEQEHDLIILDDAFQHRKVTAGYNILLFDYRKILSPQFLLPAGNLREFFMGYKRAQQILITKVSGKLDEKIKHKIRHRFSPSHSPCFSRIKYGTLQPVYDQGPEAEKIIDQDTRVLLLTGIANPQPLHSYVKEMTPHIVHFDYPDHYSFTAEDIRKVILAFEKEKTVKKLILTTEKDAQRLSDIRIKELLLNLPVFYLPIKIDILAEDKATFDQNIIDYVSNHTRNRRLHK
jgi:tetraacyldisaccharide 4'-kinase